MRPAIWNKAGPLTDGEWESVRLHPYYTERILSRATPLAQLGAIGAAHHERLDGSGYHRRLPAPMLSPRAAHSGHSSPGRPPSGKTIQCFKIGGGGAESRAIACSATPPAIRPAPTLTRLRA
jgi:hypothetical protein